MEIQNFKDFTDVLLKCGFSMGGGSAGGIFAAVPFSWNEEPPYKTQVRWHTEDPETDPWEWRMRVLNEREDIAYAKLFFKKSGYITREWYPYFLAARRGGRTFSQIYEDGVISHEAKRIYEIVREGPVATHAIKALGGFGKEEKSAFDRALTELQMKMLITICGRKKKLSNMGLEYGWNSTVMCTAEEFFGEDVFIKAAKISGDEAEKKITAQIYKINPSADEKKIGKFILGK